MSNHLTREHIDALKSRLATTRPTSSSQRDDLGAISVDYWKDRAVRAEARAAAAEARLDGLLAALSALRMDADALSPGGEDELP